MKYFPWLMSLILFISSIYYWNLIYFFGAIGWFSLACNKLSYNLLKKINQANVRTIEEFQDLYDK